MKQSYMNNLVLIILLSFGVLFGLTGCKESERDRVLMYQKGTYLGPADEALGDLKIRELQNRTRYQFASGN